MTEISITVIALINGVPPIAQIFVENTTIGIFMKDFWIKEEDDHKYICSPGTTIEVDEITYTEDDE